MPSDNQEEEMRRSIQNARRTLEFGLLDNERQHLSRLIDKSESLINEQGAYHVDTVETLRNLTLSWTGYSRNINMRNERRDDMPKGHVPGY